MLLLLYNIARAGDTSANGGMSYGARLFRARSRNGLVRIGTDKYGAVGSFQAADTISIDKRCVTQLYFFTAADAQISHAHNAVRRWI